MNNRIEYIDILRGFAIFLVTLGHVLEKSGYHESPLFAFIYSFHMPLFFCISGYVCALSSDKRKFVGSSTGGGNSFILKKLKFILVPYLVWSLLVGPFFFYTYNGDLDWMVCFKATCIDNTSYWFLPCLFGLIVCYYIEKIVCEYLKIDKLIFNLFVIIVIAIFLIALFKVTHYDFFRSIISYFVLFWIGVFMNRNIGLYELITENKLIYALALVLFCLIEGSFSGHEGILFGKMVRFTCGILAIPVMFNFFKHIVLPDKLHRMMVYIGQNTLPIYLMQSCFLKGMVQFPEGLNVFYQIVLFSTISVIMMGIILLITTVLGQSIYLRQTLLGKK